MQVIKQGSINGRLAVPPEKNILQRRIMAASLSAARSILDIGSTVLERDCSLMLRAVADMRLAHIEQNDGCCEIIGNLPCVCPAPDIFCANSDSTMQMLMPVALAKCSGARFLGEPRLFTTSGLACLDELKKRSVIIKRGEDNLLIGGLLPAGKYVLTEKIRSPFISGLLFALPMLDEQSCVKFAAPDAVKPMIDIDLDILRTAGIDWRTGADGTVIIPGKQAYRSIRLPVEGDFLFAAFFFAAAAALGRVEIINLPEHSAQADFAIIDRLREYGAIVRYGDGCYCVESARCQAFDCDMTAQPGLTPLLLTLACFAAGKSRFYNSNRLDSKMLERAAVTISELSSCGARIEAAADGVTVYGGRQLHSNQLDAHGDFLVAMALTLAALMCDGKTTLIGTEQLTRRSPIFWQQLDSILNL